ncbi:RNA polymerase II transcription elongation factor-domain-containing protein [Suillus lakei]|nr:RNA polymerase II transcription elongation factor-domain-containing protein [Suillus lakei]
MATADTQWMPTTGRHSVAIGTSLRRALKARKGVAPPKRSNLPDKDFYSFRYNFKPESIEPSRSGTIEVKRGKDSTSVTLERPSTQAGENHLFKGAEQPIKEYDCVLIYDEELGTFTLEKIECFMGFTYDKKVSSSSSSFARKSPSATTPPAGQVKDTRDLEKELERDLLGLSDADGEASRGQKQEEEEEGEEIEIPFRKAPSPPPPPPKPKVTRPAAPPPKKHESEPKPKPKPKEVPKAKRESNPYREDSDLEEVLDFGRPARPPNRAETPCQGQHQPFVPPAPPTKPAVAESDSEEDWDEVTHNDPVEEEIDLDAFGREMEAELEEESDDDILAAAMSPDLEPVANVSGRPMSLNQFAGGQLSADEDDTSSSEDSDED